MVIINGEIDIIKNYEYYFYCLNWRIDLILYEYCKKILRKKIKFYIGICYLEVIWFFIYFF